MAGRVGEMLCDVRFWLAVCLLDHDKIHRNPKWAYENGYLLSRTARAKERYLASLAELKPVHDPYNLETDPPF